MLIDWFTVGAQVLNFLILVWLMKRFLYKPILKAIEAREKLVQGQLSDAAAMKAEAKKDQDQFQSKNAAFDQERAALLSKATSDAKAESQKLMDDARKAADILQAKRIEAMATDANNLNQSIKRRAQEEVFAIARKTLTDLAAANLEERIGAVFIEHLRAMDGSAKKVLGQALTTDTEPATVRSTFALSDEQRAAIQKALNETFSAAIRLRFETTPELVSGIELTSNGQKIEWSIAGYLTAMEADLSQLLKNQAQTGQSKDTLPETNKITNSDPKLAPQQQDSEHAA
jgi:F-type H+-transporting ATPase subunit b